MAADHKNWAEDYVTGPLHDPTPAEETGLNTSFRVEPTAVTEQGPSAFNKQNTGSSVETNPFRRSSQRASSPGSLTASPTLGRPTKNGTSTHTRVVSNGSVPSSGRTTPSKNPFTTTESPINDDGGSRRRSGSLRDHGPPPTYSNHAAGVGNRPRRSSSLREKFPGDPSVHPLEQLARENRAASRSPHLKKKHHHGSDSIDKLDDASFLGAYHHEGPYDAASLARNNTNSTTAPLQALKNTNAEALKATPREAVLDSIERHRPLDHVAIVPPGERDALGREYRYREGFEEDMMRNGNPVGGPYKRYADIDYHPADLKGKGEPSYTIEKRLKDHAQTASRHGSAVANGEAEAVELVERPRRDSDTGEAGGIAASGNGKARASGHRRDGSGSGSGLDGLKRRIGSLRRKDK